MEHFEEKYVIELNEKKPPGGDYSIISKYDSGVYGETVTWFGAELSCTNGGTTVKTRFPPMEMSAEELKDDILKWFGGVEVRRKYERIA